MRAFFVVLGALVGFSFAHVSTPSCAANCLETYLPQSGCNATDAACVCSDLTLMGQVQNCTVAACTVREGLTALNATKTFCGEPVRDRTVVTPVVTSVLGALAIAAVTMRIWDSVTRDTLLNWSNFSIALSLACSIAIGVIVYLMSSLGFGRDIWTIPHDNITQIILLTWISELVYMVVNGMTKVAMLLFYLKVFPDQNFRRSCYVMVAICVAYVVVTDVATFFNCTPVSYNWTGWMGETVGQCFNYNHFAWTQSSINILLDLIVILLPIPQLWRLNMGKKKRIQLVLMFSLGLFITVVSVVRLTALVNFGTTTNATYDNIPTAYWSDIEVYVSIICCCLPAVRSCLKRSFPTCFSSNGDSKNTLQPYLTPKSPRHTPSGGIQKSITNTVTFEPSSPDGGSHNSDIELVDDRRWRDSD